MKLEFQIQRVRVGFAVWDWNVAVRVSSSAGPQTPPNTHTAHPGHVSTQPPQIACRFFTHSNVLVCKLLGMQLKRVADLNDTSFTLSVRAAFYSLCPESYTPSQ